MHFRITFFRSWLLIELSIELKRRWVNSCWYEDELFWTKMLVKKWSYSLECSSFLPLPSKWLFLPFKTFNFSLVYWISSTSHSTVSILSNTTLPLLRAKTEFVVQWILVYLLISFYDTDNAVVDAFKLILLIYNNFSIVKKVVNKIERVK